MAKANQNTVLNLDEVFGQSKPITVKWQGRDYDVFAPQALSPMQLIRWERLAKQVRTMSQGSQEEIDDKSAAEIERTVDSAISIIAPDLDTGAIPFMAKVRIISWYIEQVSPDLPSDGDDDSPNLVGGQTSPS